MKTSPQASVPAARRIGAALFVAVIPFLLSGCLYDAILGKSQGVGSIATAHPCDGVVVDMIRAVEDRRPEEFAKYVDVAAVPARDQFWLALTNFLNRAEAVEYVVTVERRNIEGIKVIYTLSWTRKYEDKTNGQVVTTSGRSEWSFIENLGAYTLISATGTPIF